MYTCTPASACEYIPGGPQNGTVDTVDFQDFALIKSYLGKPGRYAARNKWRPFFKMAAIQTLL